MVDLQAEAQLGKEDYAIPDMVKVVGGCKIEWAPKSGVHGLGFCRGVVLDCMPYLTSVVAGPAAQG